MARLPISNHQNDLRPRFLVTGGNGFLGSWLVRRLITSGAQVCVLHRPKSDLSALKDLSFESVLGDVTDFESLDRATRRVQGVYHVAGLVSYNPKDFPLMESVNVKGTENLLNACIKNGVPRMVHTSSVVAVGASEKKVELSETSKFDPVLNRYGYYFTKKKAEDLVIAVAKQKRIHAVVVNPSVMFGAGDAVKGSRKTHLKVAAGQFAFYPPGGVNVVHVADVVEGHLLAFQKGRSGERYILGGENIRTKTLFEWLAKANHKDPPKILLPRTILKGASIIARALKKTGISKNLSADHIAISYLYHWYNSSKAIQELGFKTLPAEQAIVESVAWSKANGYLRS